ncbi:YceI family protein [Neptunitalea lumnitzerae]|uniref:Lipid/polyisoprenoid-binding YceI-like domain-containing protein n=1 Tax=Neptunitalea lumnitzerae TaxID=2965509 RepID=A0ABQ5MM76_9FLAO|nr:YceI family protein [Neptunitalea sp. Y10]GLB50513.1 hypothetical protein Y10_28810 [Neptunitalea sp. Y10]
MKTFFLSIVCLMCVVLSVNAQKYVTRTGEVSFEASVPSFEEVAAQNKEVSVIFSENGGKLAALTFMKAFRFKVALMEEHFNENYVESDTYPKAVFKGGVKNFTKAMLSAEVKECELIGDITLHGKTKKVTIKAQLFYKDEVLHIKGDFKVKPEDFDIEIPSVVSSKIAEEILVTFDFNLKKQ